MAFGGTHHYAQTLYLYERDHFMNKCTLLTLGFLASIALVAPLSAADVWDLQSDSDDLSNTTDNQLIPGSVQQHDLEVRPGPLADQDWYLFPQKPHSSYEIIIDNVSGDLGITGLTFDRLAPDRTTIVQSAEPAVAGSLGFARALRFTNDTDATVNGYLRVANAFCSTTCGGDDIYVIRVRETTVNVARFNNAASQTTVVHLQNTTNQPLNVTSYYWSAGGALLTKVSTVLSAKAMQVLMTASVPELAGLSGHLTVAHDGPYAGVNVRAIALEPETGFSFDTPGVYVDQ